MVFYHIAISQMQLIVEHGNLLPRPHPPLLPLAGDQGHSYNIIYRIGNVKVNVAKIPSPQSDCSSNEALLTLRWWLVQMSQVPRDEYQPSSSTFLCNVIKVISHFPQIPPQQLRFCKAKNQSINK